MATDRATELLDQLTWYWDHQARPRLEGLGDEEYLWEPAAGAWNVRPRGKARTAMAAGAGDWVADFELPEPTPAPVTTIAWRLGHVIVGVFGMRTAAHFAGPPCDYQTFPWSPDSATALSQLDDAYGAWVAGVSPLDAESLNRAVGPAEGPWADWPLSALVLHINREAIHHLAEVALLRDLYAARVLNGATG